MSLLNSPARGIALALCLVFVVALLLASGERRAGADTPTGDISRVSGSGAILHRRLPAPPGSGEQAAVFRYDPLKGGPLPSEVNVDGQVLPAPPVTEDAKPGEVVYSLSGLRDADEPEAADARTEPVLAPGEGEGEGPGTTPGGTGGAGEPGGVVGDPGEGGEPGEAAEPGDPGEQPLDWPEPPGSPSAPAAEGRDPGDPGDPATEPLREPEDNFDPRGTIGERARPDRSTQREGTLNYHAVFDPSVVPFKRNRALNGVKRDYELFLERGRLEPLELSGNQVSAGREVFWGSVLIEGRTGQYIPLPSVSPDSRILSYEAVPKMDIRFYRDRAGNFYAKPGEDGRARLVFVMDAPSTYFGRTIPPNLRLAQIPSSLAPNPAPAARRSGLRFARSIGLSPRMGYTAIVNKLVQYFRGFEPGDPPPPTGDIYTDLATAQKGVCRHRAFAFVVTAQALGIPAHYVFNEAHVFVEVYVPGRDAGWLRIDLGGGAERLVVHSGQDKVQHRPRTRDPFDRPEPFANDLAQGRTAGATQVEGLPDEGERLAPTPPEEEPMGGEGVGELLDTRIARPEPVPDKAQTRTSLAIEEALVFRGDGLVFSGAVTDSRGRAVNEGTVQLLLLDGLGRPVRLLGTAKLDGNGRYQTTLTVPVEQAPGAYSVVADFLGDDTWSPSSSE